MEIVFFTIFIVALIVFFFYKIKVLLTPNTSESTDKHPEKVIQLPDKGDNNVLERTTKFTLEELTNGYTELAKLLLHTCKNETIYTLFNPIEEVKSKDIKPAKQGIHYLFKLLNHYGKEENFLFFVLDWKDDIKELHHHIEQRLEAYHIKANLPKHSDYPDYTHVSYPNVLKDYTYALNRVGLGLGFVRNPTDSYILFIYRLKDSEKTFWALNHVGLNIEPYKDEWDD